MLLNNPLETGLAQTQKIRERNFPTVIRGGVSPVNKLNHQSGYKD